MICTPHPLLFGDQIEKNEMGGACSSYGVERRDAYGILVGKLEGNGPLGRPRCRWQNNTKMSPQEVGWGGGG
jgi:hypothetical protein